MSCTLSSKHQQNSDVLMGYHGPGIWFCFHTMSLNAVNTTTKTSLIYFIRKTIDSFKCETCRGHAVNYLSKNPPELHLHRLFEWTVDFHNDVNLKNDKTTWSYSKAAKYYK